MANFDHIENGQLEPIRPEPFTVWTTRDGQKIPLAEMGGGHLRNTLAMMRRKLKDAEMAEAADALGYGEMPSETIEGWLSALENETARRIVE